MNPMSIDPQSLTSAAQALSDCANQLGDGLSELQTTLTSASPWGGDDAGTVFGAIYTEVLGHALDAIVSHVRLLGTAAQNLAECAQQVADSDGDSARGFAGLGARLGG